MKKSVCIAVMGIVAGFAVISGAEDIERNPGHSHFENKRHCPEKAGHHRGPGRGSEKNAGNEAMMINALRMPQVAEKIGLSEAQRKKIEHKLKQIEDNHLDLKYKMEKAALKQACLMTAKKLDEEALMDVVEEMGGYRTQMAKQRIKLIIFMRETLTPEQIETMQTMMHKRMKARHQEHSKKSDREGRRGSKRNSHK
jgi:Spy/CpxP family protein refolding chaperone